MTSDWFSREWQLFHLRNRITGGETHYDMTAIGAHDKWMVQSNPKQWYCSAMAPTEKTVIQGEVQVDHRGLCLLYSTVKKPMRAALADCAKQVYGLQAKMMLQAYLCPRSRDWLNQLIEWYSGHVIEFSVYSENWGAIPGYNTVFWETRLY